jgi:hypothetical protein
VSMVYGLWLLCGYGRYGSYGSIGTYRIEYCQKKNYKSTILKIQEFEILRCMGYLSVEEVED